MRPPAFALLVASVFALSCGAQPVAPPEVTIAAVPPTSEPSAEAVTAPLPATTTRVHGLVTFFGRTQAPKVPRRRKDAEFCKKTSTPHNALVVTSGRLADVFVRIENGAVPGVFAPPTAAGAVRMKDCNYQPRVMGLRDEQAFSVSNEDGTLHNVHAYRRNETWFNVAMPKGSIPLSREMDGPGTVKLISDIFPWMRAFVFSTDHPFFTVTGTDGAFQIEGFPPGKYTIEAWHSLHGWKRATVEVAAKESVEVSFTYTGREPAPAENEGELENLF